jgi:two-component system sensor histidine kinase VicK
MEPGVPFALLGAVQLLAIGAAVGLAGAAVLRRNAAGFVLTLGALMIAAVEVATSLRLGDTTSDGLGIARGVAGLLLAVGILTGGLGPRQVPTSAYVVVPLAAALGPSSFAGVASVLAALAAVRARRDATGLAVAAGLVLWGGAAFLSVRAHHGSGTPEAVLVLRGAGALALLLGLGLLARSSLLSKVVGAILAGVLAMAVAAVGVVGNVVVSSYDQQARDTVRDAAAARDVQLREYLENVVVPTATSLSTFCDSPGSKNSCAQLAENKVKSVQIVPKVARDFLVRVHANGQVDPVAQRNAGVTNASLLLMRRLPAVRAVLAAKGTDKPQVAVGTVLRLEGARPGIALAGVMPQNPNDTKHAAAYVYVYGVLLDQQFAEDQVSEGGFGLYFLGGDPLRVLASNKPATASKTLLAIAQQAHVASGVPAAGLTVGSQGVNPTAAFRPLTNLFGDAIGYFAITRDPGPALSAQRDALRLLVITSLAALLLVAVLAIVLGRRTVEPVRQLTRAAEQISGGDLSVATGVRTRDEVGTLASRFDTMTASLGQLTGDLREAAARLATVLASMTDGLLATDASGIVTSVNRAALEMLGLEEMDVVGESLSVVADVRDLEGNQLAGATRLLREEAAEVVRPDGTRVPVRVAVTALQDAEGLVMVLRDTTREREVERMKTEFLSNVSHELRTPLTPIRGYAEILVSKPGLESPQVSTFATTIRDEAVKMNRVVDLLVDVAALEAGRVSVVPKHVSARELLDARLDVWKGRAPARHGDLKRRIAAGLPPLHVDPVWVGKALDELIDNAVKYTPPGTPITLIAGMAPSGDRVRVTVKDAGPGIPEADQAGLFMSFEQVDGSATRKVGGLGLGLSFVRRLAEDAGFPLAVSSKVGKGSEFSLDLPVSNAPATRRGSRAAPR